MKTSGRWGSRMPGVNDFGRHPLFPTTESDLRRLEEGSALGPCVSPETIGSGSPVTSTDDEQMTHCPPVCSQPLLPFEQAADVDIHNDTGPEQMPLTQR